MTDLEAFAKKYVCFNKVVSLTYKTVKSLTLGLQLHIHSVVIDKHD